MAYTNGYSKEEQKALAIGKVEKALTKASTDVVDVFATKDEFSKYLAFAARFHYFDVNNTLLIYKQRPNATFLAPFKAWEKYSLDAWGDSTRLVFPSDQKGKGIGILAPYILKKSVVDPAANRNKIISYFDYHVVFLFDKAQTNNIPAPVLAWDISSNSQDSAALFSALSESAPFTICFSNDITGSKKYLYEPAKSNHSRGKMKLRQEDASDFYTLCSHIMSLYVKSSLENVQTKHSEDNYRKVCECVGFMLASYFGLPTDDYSLFFVKLWGDNNPEKMMAILNTVQMSAHKLINTLEEKMVFYKSINGGDDIYDNDSVFEFENFYDL